MLPNLIIAGVNKGGTTALFRHLASHPDISPSSIKETCYFLPIRYGDNPAPLSEYKKYFREHQNESLVIESTPGYFYGGIELASKIKSTLPNVRIVIVLREPVSRFLSFFYFMKSMQKLHPKMTSSVYFDKCKNFSLQEFDDPSNNPYFGLQGGRYNDYLDDWTQIFGDRLHIDFFENLISDPAMFMESISNFSGIDPTPFYDMNFKKENVTTGHHNERFHSFALWFYKSFSRVFHSNSVIKRLAASTYNKINGAPVFKDDEEEALMRSALLTYYQSSNDRLKNKLLKFDGTVGSLPNWLS